MWRRKLVEVENECTLHNFSLFVIFLPEIIKIGGYLTKLWQKQFCTFLDTVYLQEYCIHPVFRIIACYDLDLWPQKLITTSTNPNISATKIGWNSLHWFVRYSVHKVFGPLPAVTLTSDLLTLLMCVLYTWSYVFNNQRNFLYATISYCYTIELPFSR